MKNNGKARLVKKQEGWYNLYQGGIGIGSTHSELQGHKLSLKACQAIERGYDLDELAKIEYPICEVWDNEEALIRELAFKKGFKKALELLGDTKFSEEDLRLAMHFGQFGEANNQTTTIGFIQSLQQTEWDVKIVTKNSRTGKIINSDSDLEWDEDGLCDVAIPKLDADGCLILKRINL